MSIWCKGESRSDIWHDGQFLTSYTIESNLSYNVAYNCTSGDEHIGTNITLLKKNKKEILK
jgi:hypothetical protein